MYSNAPPNIFLFPVDANTNLPNKYSFGSDEIPACVLRQVESTLNQLQRMFRNWKGLKQIKIKNQTGSFI